jgi:hypothetical protein
VRDVEHLWSRADADHGGCLQIGRSPKRLNQAKIVAVGLVERGSISWLRKAIKSREPEGPQDSIWTLTATACPRPALGGACRSSDALAGGATSGSGLAARLGLTERPRPRARIERLDAVAGWADRDESRVSTLRSDDDPAAVCDGR